MKLDPKQYDEMVNRASPPSPVVRDCVWAFCVGGAICTLGEGLRQLFLIWYDKTLAGTLTSIALIFLAAVFTLPGWYQKLAAKAGAGTLVPITGFANAVVSAAIEFKAEGRVLGTGAKMFTIAGPVLVYGITTSIAYGLILYILSLF